MTAFSATTSKDSRSPQVSSQVHLGVNFGGVTPIEGLYLNFAVICEKVLSETDGVLSFIRVIDQLTVSVRPLPGIDALPALPSALPVALTFAIGFKSAGYTGPVPITLRVETPTGTRLPELETTSQVTEANRGINLVFPMQLPVQDEGLYWFVVEVMGSELTRVPLRISRQIDQQATPPQAEEDMMSYWDLGPRTSASPYSR